MSKCASSFVISPGFVWSVSFGPDSHGNGGLVTAPLFTKFSGFGGQLGAVGVTWHAAMAASYAARSIGVRLTTWNCVWWRWIGCESAVRFTIVQRSVVFCFTFSV